MPNLILHGATSPSSTVASAAIFDALTGVKQSLVHCHFPLMSSARMNTFPVSLADALWKQNQLFMATLGTWDLSTRVAWTADDVVAGKYDVGLAAYAAGIAAWKHPVFLRLDHEMNGTWAPWFMSGPDFVRVWQHLVTVFGQAGATNVTWVWCPNQVDLAGSNSSTAADNLGQWYPGDQYVDWSGFDAYNGATARNSSWQSWSQVAGLTYATLASLVPTKPMLIGEFASHDAPGNKAAWITDALQVIATQMPLVRAISWFQKTDRANWPLTATDGSAAAYAAGLRSGPYAQQFPMPPDLAPIKPLVDLVAWGDPIADLTAQVGTAVAATAAMQTQRDQAVQSLGVATGQLVVSDASMATLQAQIADLQAQLAAAPSSDLQAQLTAAQQQASDAVTALAGERTRSQDFAQRVLALQTKIQVWKDAGAALTAEAA